MSNLSAGDHGIKILCPSGCENAPKKKVLKELIIAFATKDIPTISVYAVEDIKWDIVNILTVQGNENVAEVLENNITSRIVQIEILNIITHGKSASVNGTVILEDKRIFSFCNVYTFVSAGKNKIKDLTTYVIKMT